MRMLTYWLVILWCCCGILSPAQIWAASLDVAPPVERPPHKRKKTKRWQLKQQRHLQKRRLSRQQAAPPISDNVWVILGIIIAILSFAVPLLLVAGVGLNVLIRGLMFINAILWTSCVLIPLLTKPPSERKFLYLVAATILLSMLMSAAFLLGSIWLLLGVFVGLLGLLILMIFSLAKLFSLTQTLDESPRNGSSDTTRE